MPKDTPSTRIPTTRPKQRPHTKKLTRNPQKHPSRPLTTARSHSKIHAPQNQSPIRQSKRHKAPSWGWPAKHQRHIDWPKNRPPDVFAGWKPPEFSKENVFLRIAKNNVEIGVIELKLFDSVLPKTAHNFRQLAMGSKRVQDMPLHYKNTRFFRVIKKFLIQGGDITNNNGTGGASIYGRHFPDENFSIKHDRPFLLGSANRGPNTNNSGFYITTVPAPWLDGRSVVFGEVVYGHDVVREIEYTATNAMDTPIETITIIDCGVVNNSAV